MKKRNIVIAIFVTVIMLGEVITMFSGCRNKQEILEFNLRDYQWEIENFPSEENVGKVDNLNTAIEKAKYLWSKALNSKVDLSKSTKKTKVYYDTLNECWLVTGTLPKRIDGSVPCALIEKDGRVLAVWMD